MANPRHDREDDGVDPRMISLHEGALLDQQEDSENRYSTNIDPQGAFDEGGSPTSFHPPGPLGAEVQALHIAPYNLPDLDLEEAAHEINQGQTTATPVAPVASEPYNHVRRHAPPRNNKDGYTNLDHVIDTLLPAQHSQDTSLSQAQVGESLHLDFTPRAPVASAPTVDGHHGETNFTPDGGCDFETAILELLEQDLFANTNSRAPANVDDLNVQPDLFHSFQGAYLGPELLTEEHEATFFGTSAFHPQPQAVLTPAPLPLQGYPVGQPAFIDNAYGYVRPAPEEGYSIRDGFAGAFQSDPVTDQHFGAQDYDEYFATPQDLTAMPPPSRRRRQPGSHASHATPSSSSVQNLGQNHHGYGFPSFMADQSTPADSIACSFDGTSDALPPPPARPVPSKKRPSDTSLPSTQQSGLWSRGSDEQDLSSPPTTTPSQANPTKRQRGSRTSRSEADNGHVVDTPAEHNGSEIVSPTTDAGGVFAQPSSDASARPFICHKLTLSMNVCLKGFEKRSGLRKHEDTHDREKMTKHKCEVCQRGFRHPKDLDKHMVTHDGTKVPCPGCHKLFTREDNLNRHRRRCSGAARSSAAAGTQ